MLTRIKAVVESHGVRGAIAAARGRLLRQRASSFGLCARLLRERNGLEIGGPSALFGPAGILPVYPIVHHLDNCNFASTTLWEGQVREGLTFRFDPEKPAGRQYVAEASNLSMIATATYDFILSSHTLEHTANPLRALSEWIRVLKPDGVLVLIVPHKEGTFDHRRPVTSLAHVIEDFSRQTEEGDMTHLGEVVALHDSSRDPKSGDAESFARRCERNLEFRSMHHHVFDTRLVIDVVDHAGLQIEAVEPMWPFHVICIARKSPAGLRNRQFQAPNARHFRASPFKTDRDVARRDPSAGPK